MASGARYPKPLFSKHVRDVILVEQAWTPGISTHSHDRSATQPLLPTPYRQIAPLLYVVFSLLCISTFVLSAASHLLYASLFIAPCTLSGGPRFAYTMHRLLQWTRSDRSRFHCSRKNALHHVLRTSAGAGGCQLATCVR
jgi:hypothetical protein